MLRPYVDVLRTPGALAFSSVGALARLPISMVGLGTVLLISSTRDSYALAGALAAAIALSNAGGAPLTSRLADRHGQHRVAPPLILMHCSALLCFAWLASTGKPAWLLFPFAILAGAAAPSLGNYVRARWSHALNDPGRMHTAFSYESILDEVIFVAGPPLATVLALSIAPPAALIASAALIGVFGLWLATMRATEPPPSPALGGSRVPVMRTRGMPALVVVFILIGGVFGSFEVVTVGFADERGAARATGLLLGLYALGSMVSGLVVGALPPAAEPHRRFVRASVALGVVSAPLAFVPSTAALGLAGFVAGLAVSPALITGFGLVERFVAPGQLTEGLSWSTAGIGIGLALAAAISGWAIDEHGAQAAFSVTLACAVLAAVVAILGRASFDPRRG